MADWWKENIDPDLSNILIEFNITLSGKKVVRDWTLDVSVDYDTLEDDLETASSIYAFWSSILAEARKRLRTTQLKIDIQKSKIIREINVPEGVKLTNQDKENIVNVDDEYVKLRTTEIIQQNTVDRLFAIIDSLKIKSDNIRSLAGFKRQELSGS